MRQDDAEFGACPLPFPAAEWRVKVLRMVDADTAVVRVDRGWFDGSTLEIRLADLDCWERWSGTEEERARGAAAWREAQRLAEGRWALLATTMDREKYGRILGTLRVLQDDGTLLDLSEALRAAGAEKEV